MPGSRDDSAYSRSRKVDRIFRYIAGVERLHRSSVDGVGECAGGALEGFGGVEETFCVAEFSGLDKVGDPAHLAVKCGVQVEHDAAFRRAAQMPRVFRE